MKVIFHKNFKKQYKKLRPGEQKNFIERIALFAENHQHSILNNHALRGEYKNYRSVNITGDIRALYELIDEDTALFIIVDTHSNLYF